MRWIHIGVRLISKILWLFPIKRNRIIFTAYKGAQFSCNPKYIFLELYSRHKDEYEFIWCLNDPKQLPQEFENVKVVPYKSLKYIYFQITSKVVILNHANPIYIALRKQQLKINTWHGGGAYKKVSLAVNSSNYRLEKYKAKYELRDTDIFISSSNIFTKVMSASQLLPKEIFLECGMPRNNIFFKHLPLVYTKVRETLKIDQDHKLVIYAPTYRGKQDSKQNHGQLDISALLETLKEEFGGEWRLLLRSHINSISNQLNSHQVIDVTNYLDMQELLYASDVLITDYSSSIWDFSLTYKPGFIFAPDLQDYIENRGFYTPIEDWQYPYATNNEDLKKIIHEFDEEKNKMKIKKHFEMLGSFESEESTTQVCEKINFNI